MEEARALEKPHTGLGSTPVPGVGKGVPAFTNFTFCRSTLAT